MEENTSIAITIAKGTENKKLAADDEKKGDSELFNKPPVKIPAIKNLQSMESSGSATGNPRNKVALRPGHSLMDWVRLGNSGRDLTGVGGIPREVTPSELAKHNRNDDVWIAVKGRVYNVTHYLDFHPGGVTELMRGAGSDSTKLFNEVHAWVNHEQILNKCLVGPLRGSAMFSDAPAKSQSLVQRLFGKKSPPNSATQQKTEMKPQSSITPAPSRSPRLDWFQQLGSVTLVLYSGMVPRGRGRTPPWVRFTMDERGLTVSLLVCNVAGTKDARYMARLNLHAPVRWPPIAVKVQSDSGKVEILLSKETEALWSNYGEPAEGHGETLEPGTRPDSELWWAASLTSTVRVTHDTQLLTLQFEARVCFTLPVGCHLRVRLKGADVSRSYTPVAPTLEAALPATNDHVTLLVKRYASGLLTPHLCDLSTSPESVLEVTGPLISFDARRVTSSAGLFLVAAGTGITPMLRVIALALQDQKRACSRVRLMFFNRTEVDIIWRDQFERLAEADSRFQVIHVLSEASSEWSGLRGRVSRELLETLLDLEEGASAASVQPIPALVCICGPEPFTLATQSLLQDMDLPEEQLHCFLG